LYSHCIFCKAEFGPNQEIEKFPIGRRIAFDAERGRLWAVCRRCGRWNLSPIEERWEAIEDCERKYRETTTRVATEHIGLACLPDGLDLIRIGQPHLPEFAAWRYGERLLVRRRRYMLAVAAGVGVVTLGFGGPLLAGVSLPLVAQAPGLINWIRNNKTVTRVRSASGIEHKVSRLNALQTGIRTDGPHWLLDVHHKNSVTTLDGDAALRTAALLLPHINASGANRDQVQSAVKEIQRTLTVDLLFTAFAARPVTKDGWGKKHLANLASAPAEIRLALEMATHESQERRALEGELAELETMWREAEEIAGIADNLLLPARIIDFFKQNKRGEGA
jgi:hypothetical protein